MSEKLARRFHEVYERLAPSYGYETRSETRDFDPESPNGKLMIRVCGEVCGEAAAEIERLREENKRLQAEIKGLNKLLSDVFHRWCRAVLDDGGKMELLDRVAREVGHVRKDAEIERLRESCRSLYDENKRLLGGNAGLREEIERLHAACNDLVESAQGGKHGEIICDIDDFNAVEKLLQTDDQEKKA